MALTARWGGIDILWADMLRQTEQDFELVLVDALWREREKEVKAYINDPRLKYVHQNNKVEGAYTNLAHADNQGFKACSGDIIVLLQDYIWIGHEALAKFWFYYKNTNGKALITGVGHQYDNPAPVNKKGKITVFKEPYTQRPTNQSWQDPRMKTDRGTFYECLPVEWEMNFAMIPRAVIYDLGGMDEQYDFEGFAWDNTNIAERAAMLGYKIYIDQTNECMGFNHDKWWPNPLKKKRISPAKYHFKQMNRMRRGETPIRYNFLV